MGKKKSGGGGKKEVTKDNDRVLKNKHAKLRKLQARGTHPNDKTMQAAISRIEEKLPSLKGR